MCAIQKKVDFFCISINSYFEDRSVQMLFLSLYNAHIYVRYIYYLFLIFEDTVDITFVDKIQRKENGLYAYNFL